MKYPCILHDQETGYYFVAGSTGPVTWNYHRFWLCAWFELMCLWESGNGSDH